MKKIYTKAFTTIELLIVIVVIGILAAISYVSYGGLTQRAHDNDLQTNVDKMATAQQLYATRNLSVAGKAYFYSGTGDGYDADLDFRPSEGNIIDVVVSPDGYCIRGYNPGGTKNSITNAYEKESSEGICSILNPSSIALGLAASFVSAWSGSGVDYGYSIVQTSDGGYAVTGYTSSYGAGNNDVILAKYTSSGDVSWSKTWGGAGDDVGGAIIQTSDGGYAVTGRTSSYGAGSSDALLIKYNSSGDVSWNKTWGGAGDDSGFSIVQTSDGGYAVTGYTSSYGAGNKDVILAKYTSSGDVSWSKTWGGAGDDFAFSIVQTSDGGYAVTGYTYSYGAGISDMLLIKYDSSGDVSWSKTWGGAGDDTGFSIVQTSDGGYAATGSTYSYGAGTNDMFLSKYTSSGDVSWSKTWGGTSTDAGHSLIQTSDGGYAVTGITYSYATDNNGMLLVKYNGSGVINNCSPPMCQSPTATISSPSTTVLSPTATISSPSATVLSPTATSTSPTAIYTVIISP